MIPHVPRQRKISSRVCKLAGELLRSGRSPVLAEGFVAVVNEHIDPTGALVHVQNGSLHARFIHVIDFYC